MYANVIPGSYKIHLNSQITWMVSSSATRFTSKAENIHRSSVKTLKEMGLFHGSPFEREGIWEHKKPLGCLEFRRNYTTFCQLLLMAKILHRLGCPKCICLYKYQQYQDVFSGILSGAWFCSINCITIGTPWKSSMGAHGNSSRVCGVWEAKEQMQKLVGPQPGDLCFWWLLIFLGGDGPLWLCVFSIKNGVYWSKTWKHIFQKQDQQTKLMIELFKHLLLMGTSAFLELNVGRWYEIRTKYP